MMIYSDYKMNYLGFTEEIGLLNSNFDLDFSRPHNAKSDIFWQTYLNLEKEVLEVSKFIYFTDVKNVNGEEKHCNAQLETFSPYIADLLVRCCVEVEAISKELYFENGGEKPRGDKHLYFDDDCLRLINRKWNTDNKIVTIVSPLFHFTKEGNKILKPLKKAYKKETYWAKAYQAVKHDRFYSLHEGNVKALIGALAALYLLNIYYKNYSWGASLKDMSKIDFGFGSSMFAVKKPTTPKRFSENEFAFSESPFVIRYKDEFGNFPSLLWWMVAGYDLKCQISIEEENKDKNT